MTRQLRLPRLLAVTALIAALAGCVGSSGHAAEVSFDGSGNGTQSDATKCDSGGTLVSDGQVDQGQVDAYVTDADGKELFHQQFDGGANLDAKSLNGASGTWTVRAVRTSDTILGSPFSGHYKFHLSC